MDFRRMLEQIDPVAARAFIRAARNVVDALLIEAARAAPASAPTERDYAAAQLDRSAPAGGWLSAEEVRGSVQRMNEALALEKWTDGLIAAFRALSVMGGAL